MWGSILGKKIGIIRHKEVLHMQATIPKWGNSQGIRIPKAFLDALGMKRYNSLSERLEAFYGKPIDEIYVETGTEISTGSPVGGEVW
jgi:antitoxin MazE